METRVFCSNYASRLLPADLGSVTQSMKNIFRMLIFFPGLSKDKRPWNIKILLLERLPEDNYQLLKYIVCFLSKVNCYFGDRMSPLFSKYLFINFTIFRSETSLGWFVGEWNGYVTLAGTLTQRSLPKSNDTLTSLNHPIKPDISGERENKYSLFSFWKGFMGITVLPTMRIVQIFENVWLFKIFSYFCLWKNKNKMREYIIWTSVINFSRNFLKFFQKLPSVYIFINWINLWKFVIITSNTYLNFIELSNTSAIFWKASIKFE